MEIQDRRIRRTQHLLAEALIALILEKGYESVTIRDITERADIGYATFFRHYHDKNELLKDVMDVVLTELIQLLGTSQPDMDPVTVGVLLFQYVQERSEVIRVLLRSHSLLDDVIEVATQNVLRERSWQPNSVVPPEIVSYYIVASSVSLIRWWLAHEMPYTPEKMGMIYHELITHPKGRGKGGMN